MKTFKSFFLLLFASALVLSVSSCSGNSEEKLPDFNMVRTADGLRESIIENGGFGGVQNGGAQILDIRSADDYAKGHIKGAINIPATATNTASNDGAFATSVKAAFQTSKPVYLYGGGMLDNVAAGRISGIGFGKENSNLFLGGFSAWAAANDANPNGGFEIE